MRFPLRKNSSRARCGLLGEVDLALLQPAQQIVGGQVRQLHLVGGVEHRIRDGLPHLNSGDLGDHVVQALEVLDVQGGVDRDPGVEQLLDVLPPPGVAGIRCIGVGQLVDQQNGGTAGERGIEVELMQGDAAILHRAAGQDFETGKESLGFRPRRWVSTTPTTTSTPSARLTRASSSMAKVFPTPGLAPKKTLSLPRAARPSASRTWARRRSGSGRRSFITSWCRGQAVQRKVEQEDVHSRLTQEAQLPALGVPRHQRRGPGRLTGSAPEPPGSPGRRPRPA